MYKISSRQLAIHPTIDVALDLSITTAITFICSTRHVCVGMAP